MRARTVRLSLDQLVAWRGHARLVALAVAGVVLLSPLAAPSHVEGFSASIVSLGLHLARGDVASFDTLFPVNLEFFGLTRLGTALFVEGLVRFLGLSGEWAIRATMWLAFVSLAVASAMLIRRWSDCGWIAALAALLLLPGVSESAFFYNDNVLSSALATVALAIVVYRDGLASTVTAGLLFGAAILARTDAVLLAPAVPLLLFRSHGRGRPFLVRWAMFGLGTIVPLVAVLAAFHSTIFDVLAISSYVVTLWNRGLSLVTHLVETVLFVGIPGGIFVGLGLCQVVRERRYQTVLLLVGVPLVFHLVSLGKLWESRQLLLLTPFAGALVVRGWRYSAPAPGGSRLASMRAVLVALTFVVLLGPLVNARFDDGPRAAIGRLRNIGEWRRWQTTMGGNLHELATFTRELAAERRVAIVTDDWSADRYVHLALLEAGYTIVRPADVAEVCRKSAEWFVRGESSVLHVRLHVPILPTWPVLLPLRLSSYGTPCLKAEARSPVFLVGPAPRVAALLGRGLGDGDLLARGQGSDPRGSSTYAPQNALTYARQAAVQLTPSMLDTMQLGDERTALAAMQRIPPGSGSAVSLQDAERLLAPRVGFPSGRRP
jgi:hypothetical protein